MLRLSRPLSAKSGGCPGNMCQGRQASGWPLPRPGLTWLHLWVQPEPAWARGLDAVKVVRRDSEPSCGRLAEGGPG